MKVGSHSLVYKDFSSRWYKKWAKELKQDKGHLDGHSLRANKFWQNAVMVEALSERGALSADNCGIGFGVGQERLPALFAKLGLKILATDQATSTKNANHWSKKELATGIQSLNRLGICDQKTFKEQVEYRPVNMGKIPHNLFSKYDFVWSNCALGHLGSIPAGLEFIESSLKCLKPGGWAVHTTELNILSNSSTIDSGSTVLFRLKDIYKLLDKLTTMGYECSNFKLTPGNSQADRRISMRPQFGNDYSKIQVMGFLATQIVLIIHKPRTSPKPVPSKLLPRSVLFLGYMRNLVKLHKYRLTDPLIRQIILSQRSSVKSIKVKPKHGTINLTIPRGRTLETFIEYTNRSDIPLFGLYSRLAKSMPIVFATSSPNDRISPFVDASWVGDGSNRPAYEMFITDGKKPYAQADYIKPKQNFAFKVTFNSNKLARGTYTETFAIVQENAGWVANSSVQLRITVK